jgi:hypothetical protein
LALPIEEASGKIRSTHVIDDEEDDALPVWTARIPIRQVLGGGENLFAAGAWAAGAGGYKGLSGWTIAG